MVSLSSLKTHRYQEVLPGITHFYFIHLVRGNFPQLSYCVVVAGPFYGPGFKGNRFLEKKGAAPKPGGGLDGKTLF